MNYSIIFIDGCCVDSSNSITPSVITDNFLDIQTIKTIAAGLYVYPEMIFSCNGSITKWIFGAIDKQSQTAIELQMWRPTNFMNFILVGSTTPISTAEMIGTNLYEYTPPIPLKFKEGYTLGILVTNNLSGLLEQRGNGPLNKEVISGQIHTKNNDFPLVTAEISISGNSAALHCSIIYNTSI